MRALWFAQALLAAACTVHVRLPFPNLLMALWFAQALLAAACTVHIRLPFPSIVKGTCVHIRLPFPSIVESTWLACTHLLGASTVRVLFFLSTWPAARALTYWPHTLSV